MHQPAPSMGQASENSVTHWLQSLRQGNSLAAEHLWDRYFNRVVSLAENQLPSHQRRASDGEDVALSVLDTLIRGAAKGHFPNLHDRRDLWCLLFAITKQKVTDLKRYEGRKKRGGGSVRGASALNGSSASDVILTLDDLCGDDPTPDFIVALEEEHRQLMTLLRNDILRQIAAATLEGYATQEIANRLQISVRAVQRKLNVIRTAWSRVLVVS